MPSRALAETVCKKLALAAEDRNLVAAGAALKICPDPSGQRNCSEVEQLFLSQRGVAVVATIAFALGVDCAHVRVHIHFVRGWHFAHLFCSPYSILATIGAGLFVLRTGGQLDVWSRLVQLELTFFFDVCVRFSPIIFFSLLVCFRTWPLRTSGLGRGEVPG